MIRAEGLLQLNWTSSIMLNAGPTGPYGLSQLPYSWSQFKSVYKNSVDLVLEADPSFKATFVLVGYGYDGTGRMEITIERDSMPNEEHRIHIKYDSLLYTYSRVTADSFKINFDVSPDMSIEMHYVEEML